MTARSAHIENSGQTRTILAWQGWRLELPREWNPVRIEGDWRAGFMLIADLHRPTLGIRWGTIREKRFDPGDWARRAIRAEVGQLAAREAKALAPAGDSWRGGLIYLDPDPPGRDVWVAQSGISGRVIELIYHARRREPTLSERVVPALVDLPDDGPMPWAIFDLCCASPAGMRLKSHRLTPGDLSLEFRDRHRWASVRQIAVAKLALSRMSLERWLRNDQRRRSGTHRPSGDVRRVAMTLDDGRELSSLHQTLHRRPQLFFIRSVPPVILSSASHDAQRDRIILAQGSDESLLRDMIRSIAASA